MLLVMIGTGMRAAGQSPAKSAAGSTALSRASIASVRARSAEEFVDSMGINVHMEYTNTPYGRYQEINQALAALRMRHFRDEIHEAARLFVEELNEIGALGYGLCGLIEGGNDYPRARHALNRGAVLSRIHNLRSVLDAVEGPNEPDDGGFVYDGVPYPQGAVNESEDLWNILQSSTETSSLPVVVMSEGNASDFNELAALTRPPIDYARYGNMHAYQGGHVGDYALENYYMPYARHLTGKAPLWTTEMGYHNYTRYLSDHEQQGVSERAAAIYLPIAFLSGFEEGVVRTFSYELIDEVDDPNLTHACTVSAAGIQYCSGEGHYGLLNFDGTPKAAYTALQNLIAVVKDGAGAVQPTTLGLGFAGAPKTMRYTLLEKSTGVYDLAVWNDVPVYRLATQENPGKDIEPGAVPVTVTFAGPESFTVYAPNDASGSEPTGAYTVATSSTSITINLPAEVLLIEIRAAN